MNNITSSDENGTDNRSDDSFVEPESNSSPLDNVQSTINLDKRERELLNEFLHFLWIKYTCESYTIIP